MKGCESFVHTRWDCKYHIAFIPKEREKAISAWYESILGRCLTSWRVQGRCDRFISVLAAISHRDEGIGLTNFGLRSRMLLRCSS
jgi:hypothetical protein